MIWNGILTHWEWSWLVSKIIPHSVCLVVLFLIPWAILNWNKIIIEMRQLSLSTSAILNDISAMEEGERATTSSASALVKESCERLLTKECSVCGGPAAAHHHYGAISCYSCRWMCFLCFSFALIPNFTSPCRVPDKKSVFGLTKWLNDLVSHHQPVNNVKTHSFSK